MPHSATEFSLKDLLALPLEFFVNQAGDGKQVLIHAQGMFTIVIAQGALGDRLHDELLKTSVKISTPRN